MAALVTALPRIIIDLLIFTLIHGVASLILIIFLRGFEDI